MSFDLRYFGTGFDVDTTIVKDIITNLKDLIAALGSFDGDPGEIFYSFQTNPTGNPWVRINLERTRFHRRGGHSGSISFDNEVELTLRMTWLGGVTEGDYDDYIEYVGDMVDAIEGSRTLGSSYVDDAWITQITYARAPKWNAVAHTAWIYLTVRVVRE